MFIEHPLCSSRHQRHSHKQSKTGFLPNRAFILEEQNREKANIVIIAMNKNKYNWNSKQQNGIVKKDFFGKDK